MATARPLPDRRLTEIAERVWVLSYDGSNATVVAGDRGLLVVDALGSPEAGEALVEQLAALDRGEVVAVVLTHGHAGHVAGLPALHRAWPDCVVHAHEDVGVADVDRSYSSVGVVQLGDRVAELVHPGRAHTGGDTVVRVPDADVLVAGDLLSQDGPAYGEECFPLDWPAALDFTVGLLTPQSLVVPGHGGLLDQPAVQDQRADVGTVAETLFDLAARSVPEDEALAAAEWPWDADRLRLAVRRGYAQVPRTARRLPLV